MSEASTPTPSQQALIDQLLRVLSDDRRVRAVYLSGSFSSGRADAFSDIDLTVAVDDAALAACVGDYGGSSNPLGPTAWLRTLFGRVVTAVTLEWERYDIVFMLASELTGGRATALRPLFTRSDAAPPQPAAADNAGAAAARDMRTRWRDAYEEFLRVLGLAHVALGRDEWLVAQEGIGLLRKALIDLMIESNGLTEQRGGVKRLNVFLTDEQRSFLETSTFPAANRASVIDATEHIAARYLPLARSQAVLQGIAWPEAFEAATRTHLGRSLGIRI